MPKLTKVREILLYSEKVAAGDVRNFFDQILKSRIPLFGFLDFSGIFSLNVVNLIITKRLNTIRFFVHEKRALSELSLLVFPYKISEPMEIERVSAKLISVPRVFLLFGSQNFLDFTVKERTQEINLRIIKVLGKFLGIGHAIDENGNKSTILSTTPERFMMVDMQQNPAVFIDILDPIPKRMSVTSRYPIFEETGISVGVDNFDVFQHTLFVGASGTGKSKALYAMIKAIEAKYGPDVKMVVIDPHGEFIKSLSDYKIVNLIDNYIEPLEVGSVKTPLMTQLIAQLLASSVGQENKYSERVLFYSTHLLSSIDKMDLRNVSLLLTDSSRRAEFISECDNDEVKRFFDEEFNDIYIHHFNDAVLPILNFVGEYELYLGGEKVRENLYDLVQKNRITVVSFNPNFFGKRMINFLAGAIINQMYILAITERLTQPTIMIVDEFQRVETKVARDILAETRKFNLYLYISMQYLGQMSKEVHDSVISNIRNIVAFKSNRQDATMLSSIMEIKIEESFKKARSQTELEESKKEMFVRLHQKECIVRLFDGKKYILPMKLKVVDVSRWGYKEVAAKQYTHLTPMQHKPGYVKPAAHDEPQQPPPDEPPPQAKPRHKAQSHQYSYEQPPQSHLAQKPDEEQEPEEEEAEPKKMPPSEPALRGNDWSSFKMDRELAEERPRAKHLQGEEEVIRPNEGNTSSDEPIDNEELLKKEEAALSRVERLLQKKLKHKRAKEEEAPAKEEEPAYEEPQPSEEEAHPHHRKARAYAEEETQPEDAPSQEAEQEEVPAEEEQPLEEEAPAEEEEPQQDEEQPAETAPVEEQQQEEEPPSEDAPEEEAQHPKKETLTDRLRRIREQSQSRMKLAKLAMKEEEGFDSLPHKIASKEKELIIPDEQPIHKKAAPEPEEEPSDEEAPAEEEAPQARHSTAKKRLPPKIPARKPAAHHGKKRK